MDRVYFKDRAKNILRNNIWYLIGMVLIAALCSMELFGFKIEYTNTNDFTTPVYYLKLLNMTFSLSPDRIGDLYKVLVAVSGVVGFVFTFFIKPLFAYGLVNVFKYASLNRIHEFTLFDGFKTNYMNIVIVNAVKYVQIFLFTLLFIVPGVIKGYELRFVNEILEEHPDWHYKQVFEESKRLTKDMKLELFFLDLSFLGWELLAGLLSVVTLGLASYAISVYPKATNAEVYLWLKEQRTLINNDTIEVEATYL